jgi:NADH-quinone oxidoreductase subunit G
VVGVRQSGNEVILPLVVDNRVAEGCVSVPAGIAETSMLGASLGEVELALVAASDPVAI